MNTKQHDPPDVRLREALANPRSSVRLQAALTAGTMPDQSYLDPLMERCAVEPDFFVRDMLTWALTRLPVDDTVSRLLDVVAGDGAQARSQALHTLSKIGDPRGWRAITPAVLGDADEDVARSAWRAAAILAPAGEEAELARELATQLGRGDREVQRSLSRALTALGEDAAGPVLRRARARADEAVRAHAAATERLLADPDEDFDAAIAEARRINALENAPVTE